MTYNLTPITFNTATVIIPFISHFAIKPIIISKSFISKTETQSRNLCHLLANSGCYEEGVIYTTFAIQ